MKKYDCYLFDFDGTTFDTKESLVPCYQYGFNAIGMSCTPEECSTFMHMSLSQAAALKGVPQEKLQDFIKAIVVGLDIEESLRLVKPFEELTEVINRLRRDNKIMGFVSGNCENHMHGILKRMEIDHLFGCVVGNESYKHPKPDGEPILVAMDRLNFSDKSKVVYIGDSLQDVAAAKSAGIDGILIDRDNSHPEFEGIKIKNLRELIY